MIQLIVVARNSRISQISFNSAIHALRDLLLHLHLELLFHPVVQQTVTHRVPVLVLQAVQTHQPKQHVHQVYQHNCLKHVSREQTFKC